ncbi:hypothetical protein pb186bvf_013874 [Paramecium bursaria]
MNIPFFGFQERHFYFFLKIKLWLYKLIKLLLKIEL